MSKPRIGIINVTGYAGVELARLLAGHPDVTLTSVTGRSAAGQALGDVFPHLAGTGLDITAELGEVDFAFAALPHKESAEVISRLADGGTPVVDISADFRLRNATLYPEWYGFEHPRPDLLARAVYGLPELYRQEIAGAKLIANPGCYPTGAILALAPALSSGLIGPEIVIDSKSGVSGAGRTLSIKTHYPEANEDVTAYALDGHRHLPEISQELTRLGGNMSLRVSFVPHLIPMTRGILTTAYANLLPGKIEPHQQGAAELRELYRDFYKTARFVRVLDAPPHTGHTRGGNYCLIYPTLDPRTGRLIVVSAIDNLVKGAAGQAVQNMNLMLGLDEARGLEMPAVFP